MKFNFSPHIWFHWSTQYPLSLCYLLLLPNSTSKSCWAAPNHWHPALQHLICNRQGCLHTGLTNRGAYCMVISHISTNFEQPGLEKNRP